MSTLERPDGVKIHWEQRGQGPLVVLALNFFSPPEVMRDLLDDLASNHRVLTYDLRGNGESTRRGPYESLTDAADLEALVERAGGGATAIAIGDGCHRAVRVAARRPELIGAVVAPGGSPLARRTLLGAAGGEELEGLAASDSVIEALLEMMRVDFRSALRAVIKGANPQLDEEGVSERLKRTSAYLDREATLDRLRAWIEDDATEEGLTLGDRLWLLDSATPWFPAETADRHRQLLPEAHVEAVPDGPISRPGLTAAVVRKITAELRERA